MLNHYPVKDLFYGGGGIFLQEFIFTNPLSYCARVHVNHVNVPSVYFLFSFSLGEFKLFLRLILVKLLGLESLYYNVHLYIRLLVMVWQ